MAKIYYDNSSDALELAHCPKLRHATFIKDNTSLLTRRESELAKLYEMYGQDESKMSEAVAKKIASYKRVIKDMKESLIRTAEHMNLPNKYGR